MKKRTATAGTITALAAAAGLFMLAGDGNGQRTKQDTRIRCGLVISGTVDRLEYHRDQCPPDPAGKPHQWLPAPIVPQPAYDSATHVLDPPTASYAVSGDGTYIVETWATPRPKTAQEITDDQTRAINALNPAAKNPICDLQRRVQALEGVQPTIATEAECDAWLKTLDTR